MDERERVGNEPVYGVAQVKHNMRCPACGREIRLRQEFKNGAFVGVAFECPKHGAVPKVYRTLEG
jgi:predicted RNA-binding Zn-ribbon protein involved in translation (DUF1610 family)